MNFGKCVRSWARHRIRAQGRMPFPPWFLALSHTPGHAPPVPTAGEATAGIPPQLSESSRISELQVRKSFVPDVKRCFKIHSYTWVNQQSIHIQHWVQFRWVDMLHFIYSFTTGGCMAVTEVNMNAGKLVLVRQIFLTTRWHHGR